MFIALFFFVCWVFSFLLKVVDFTPFNFQVHFSAYLKCKN